MRQNDRAKTESEELKKRLEFSEQRRSFLQKRLSKGSVEEDSTLWSFVDLMTLLLILFILFYSHAMTHKFAANNLSSEQPHTDAVQSPQIQETPIASEPIADNPSVTKRDASKTEDENQDESLEQLQQKVMQGIPEKIEAMQSPQIQKTSNASKPVADNPYASKRDAAETEDEMQDESLEQLQQEIMQNIPEKIEAVQSPQIQETSIASEPVADNAYAPKRDASETEDEDQDESLEQLQQKVMQSIPEKIKNDFSIHWNQKSLVLVLGERIAFNVGEANLLPDFQPTLKRIAGFISSQEGYKIAIAGHTDDVPINTAQFPSNWELSAIRAVNVAKFMILHGVDPHRVSIEGYSAYHPLRANTTLDNRQANRRVEITLIKEPDAIKPAEEMESSLP